MKKNFEKILIYLIAIVCIFGLVYNGYQIYKWNQDNKEINSIVDNINEETEINEKSNDEIDEENLELINSENEKKESIYWSYIKMNLIDVDFSDLKKKNGDTKGWIQVNGTNINYPFVQSKNNKYYLNHSFEKTYTDAGWIFLDYRNNINNLGRNNILYGHSRLDKSMFGSLKNVLTKSWYNNKDNHIIKLSSEKENTLWQVFSVYTIETESYYITTDFDNDEEFQEFIDTALERSIYKFGANVTVKDKILTLSTCRENDRKLVVQAKLIKKEKK